MFNARQLMIFYFYGTCNQKATIIQFQKLKEKAKTEEPKKDIQDLIDFVAEYKDPDNYRWFFWESWSYLAAGSIKAAQRLLCVLAVSKT